MRDKIIKSIKGVAMLNLTLHEIKLIDMRSNKEA